MNPGDLVVFPPEAPGRLGNIGWTRCNPLSGVVFVRDVTGLILEDLRSPEGEFKSILVDGTIIYFETARLGGVKKVRNETG